MERASFPIFQQEKPAEQVLKPTNLKPLFNLDQGGLEIAQS